ncbi:hypothetical protein ACOSQ4_002967 [Xanthoceras sorbifolium]
MDRDNFWPDWFKLQVMVSYHFKGLGLLPWHDGPPSSESPGLSRKSLPVVVLAFISSLTCIAHHLIYAVGGGEYNAWPKSTGELEVGTVFVVRLCD